LKESSKRELEEAVSKVEKRLTKQLEEQASSLEGRLSAKEGECTRLQELVDGLQRERQLEGREIHRIQQA
jgi:hypothetical protein